MRQYLHLAASLDGNVWRYGNPASANRRHTHAELELNLVTRGQGTYLLGSRRYQIGRGDLLWLFPAQDHVLIEQTADFEMWIAVFRRRAVKRAGADRSARPLLGRNLEGELCRRVGEGELHRLEDLFAELAAAGDRTGLLNTGLGYALAHAWRCFESAAEVPVRDIHPAVERAAKLIREDPAAMSLEELAQRVRLSAARLSRLFKEQTGFALADFRNRVRMERFFEIYETGREQTMLSAALDAGFGSYPQFHRVFKRLTGQSPASYHRRAAEQVAEKGQRSGPKRSPSG